MLPMPHPYAIRMLSTCYQYPINMPWPTAINYWCAAINAIHFPLVSHQFAAKILIKMLWSTNCINLLCLFSASYSLTICMLYMGYQYDANALLICYRFAKTALSTCYEFAINRCAKMLLPDGLKMLSILLCACYQHAITVVSMPDSYPVNELSPGNPIAVEMLWLLHHMLLSIF